jgi:hypothetical protein
MKGGTAMARATQCTGVLLWFDVPADGKYFPSSISVCSDCGELFIAGCTRDARHEDSFVFPGG